MRQANPGWRQRHVLVQRERDAELSHQHAAELSPPRRIVGEGFSSGDATADAAMSMRCRPRRHGCAPRRRTAHDDHVAVERLVRETIAALQPARGE